jgi:hypothetical protein
VALDFVNLVGFACFAYILYFIYISECIPPFTSLNTQTCNKAHFHLSQPIGTYPCHTTIFSSHDLASHASSKYRPAFPAFLPCFCANHLFVEMHLSIMCLSSPFREVIATLWWSARENAGYLKCLQVEHLELCTSRLD